MCLFFVFVWCAIPIYYIYAFSFDPCFLYQLNSFHSNFATYKLYSISAALIKETWKDRNDATQDGDIHRSETIEEKLSLVNRFGLSIGYFKPSRREFDEIVLGLAARYPQIKLSEDEIIAAAHVWEMRNGGISGRTAQQFVNHLLGQCK